MKKPMRLEIGKRENDGFKILLDGNEIHHVESYKIESSPVGNTAELSVKILVEYPIK